MPYTAKFSKIFLKKHSALPNSVKLRTRGAVKEILDKPYSGVMLVGPLKGLWKAKVGKYRILYEINAQEALVLILAWMHYFYRRFCDGYSL
jgi:mRNA-degrading endonuclease RelE of RelBE toxin-antitoxin system